MFWKQWRAGKAGLVAGALVAGALWTTSAQAAIVGGVVSSYTPNPTTGETAPPRGAAYIASPGTDGLTLVPVPFNFTDADPTTGTVTWQTSPTIVGPSLFRTQSNIDNTFGTFHLTMAQPTMGLTKLHVWQFVDNNVNQVIRSGLAQFDLWYSTDGGSNYTQLGTTFIVPTVSNLFLAEATLNVDLSTISGLAVTNFELRNLASTSNNASEKRIGLAQVVFEATTVVGRVIYDQDFDTRQVPGNLSQGLVPAGPGPLNREGWAVQSNVDPSSRNHRPLNEALDAVTGNVFLGAELSAGSSGSATWGAGLPVEAGIEYQLDLQFLQAPVADLAAGASFDLTVNWGTQSVTFNQNSAAGAYSLVHTPGADGLAQLSVAVVGHTGGAPKFDDLGNPIGNFFWVGVDDLKITVTAIPEPASLALLALAGLVAAGGRRGHRSRAV